MHRHTGELSTPIATSNQPIGEADCESAPAVVAEGSAPLSAANASCVCSAAGKNSLANCPE